MIHYCFWKGKEYGRNIHTYPLYEDLAGTIAKSPNAGKQKQAILRTSYILHIYVDTTVPFHKVKGEMWYEQLLKDWTIVYSQVLDTIKGKKLPDINTGVIARKEQLNLSSNGGDSVSSITTPINIPNNVNLIFDYCDEWSLDEGHPITRTLLDKEGNTWIKPKKEYIVLLAPNYDCYTNDGLFYYSLWPVGGSYSYGMYPVEDGNVLDEGNVWGWGKSVPLNVFKQNLNTLLNEIKNYGE